MAANPLKRLFHKGRKYPIKRDIFGRTARQWVFHYFDEGMGPAEAAPKAGVSTRTARRYRADWKKTPRGLQSRYEVVKRLMMTDLNFSQETIELIADNLGMSQEEVIERLQRPWGLKQLLMGRWPNYRRQEEQRKTEVRLEAALKLVLLFEQSEMTPEKIGAWSLEIWEKVQELKSGMQSP